MASLQREDWGSADGKKVELFTLQNDGGCIIKATNYGTIITELHVPDKNGEMGDIVLGFDKLDDYLKGHPYFGCTVGRTANRVAKGKFKLGGKNYQLATNNGPNNLHGGTKGFDKRVWTVKDAKEDNTYAQVTFEYISPSGEEGYPGTVTATVQYTFTDTNDLKILMTAKTDAPTIVNLAHHGYFNMAGHNSGTILNQVLQLNCDKYTPADKTLVPTGVLAPVQGTPFDFRKPKMIGKDIAKLPAKGDDPGGYDVNLAVNGPNGTMRRAAVLTDPKSGRRMEIWATPPGVQFYTGNFLDGTLTGKEGAVYKKHTGLCLETQHFPDSINKEGKAGWPSIILKPGATYRHEMVLKFRTVGGEG